MSDQPRPMVLAILDGWGHNDAPDHNAIHTARTPNWDRLWADSARTLINTSGIAVGLPAGQMGNSEVGHLNLGAGRVIPQDYTRISADIESGQFTANPALCQAIEAARAAGGRVHILGLLSPGGVHSHEAHLFAMVRLAAEKAVPVSVHAFLDGRDMPPRSAMPSLEKMQELLDELGCGDIASIVGRYFAMDRDKRWDRVQAAYQLLTGDDAVFEAEDAISALVNAYARGENDEFVKTTRITGANPIQDGDAVVFMNYRADRARELTRALIEKDFDGFMRNRMPALSAFVSLTEYQKDFDALIAFPSEQPHNTLGEFIASLHLKQLRVAETEKYAHVTFFFNGGEESPFDGEDRHLVPSPKVATYDMMPEMSAREVTHALIKAIETNQYDVIICNYANADMVGHTGKFKAAVKAIEVLDECLGKLEKAVVNAGGAMLITSDHGNVEQMYDSDTDQAHTAHTTNLVPLLLVGRYAEFDEGGALSDVAPTLLDLMQITPPAEMTGRSLLKRIADA